MTDLNSTITMEVIHMAWHRQGKVNRKRIVVRVLTTVANLPVEVQPKEPDQTQVRDQDQGQVKKTIANLL